MRSAHHPWRRPARGLALLALAPAAAAAQLPGVPAAPGAFVRPGLAFAANAGLEARGLAPETVDGARRSRWTYGLAAAFAPASARWQLAGGAAAQTWGSGYQDPGTSFGGRAAFVVLDRPRFGATAVAGLGFARARFEPPAGGSAAEDEDVVQLRQLPLGVAVGARGGWGGGRRAWALSVAPQYVWYRFSAGEDAQSAARPRVGLLAEVGLTPRLGVSVAYEDGARAAGGEPGPRAGTVGLALSFALGGR
jgi:hypothetical protein